VLRYRKHVGDAQQLVRRAFTICESSLGPDHPSTATARANLLTLNSELRLNDLAHFLTGEDGIERLSRLVRAVAEKSLARDHPDIVALREYLAALEVARGKGA
jgi:hypothetical protein